MHSWSFAEPVCDALQTGDWELMVDRGWSDQLSGASSAALQPPIPKSAKP